jgi:CO/xanthine dehydrogenase Mo-binding subunit
MTGLLHEKEFSRKSFLRGGGALVVGFSLAGSALAGKAGAVSDPHPLSSFGPADSNQIDSWLTVGADNTVSVKLGKVELGQGSVTGLLMVAAEEMNLDMSQMRWINNDTDLTPNQGTTAGSSAISSGGKQVRAAAAAAHAVLTQMASSQLGVDAGSLTSSKGTFTGGGKSITFAKLLGGKIFNVSMGPQYNLQPTQPPSQSQAQVVAAPGSGSSQGLASQEVLPTPAFVPSPGPGLSPGAPFTKPVSQYKIVGIRPGPQRVDIPS